MMWGATSMQDASLYIADAPYRSLQLIGGTHDWWWLLGRWQRLQWADEIANGVWFLGLGLGLAGLGLIVLPALREVWDSMGQSEAISVGGPSPVREARTPAREV